MKETVATRLRRLKDWPSWSGWLLISLLRCLGLHSFLQMAMQCQAVAPHPQVIAMSAHNIYKIQPLISRGSCFLSLDAASVAVIILLTITSINNIWSDMTYMIVVYSSGEVAPLVMGLLCCPVTCRWSILLQFCDGRLQRACGKA